MVGWKEENISAVIFKGFEIPVHATKGVLFIKIVARELAHSSAYFCVFIKLNCAISCHAFNGRIEPINWHC